MSDRVLSVDEMVRLWNVARGRERLSVGLPMLAGLTWPEIKELRFRDLDFTLPHPTIRVRGGSGPPRTVPMGPILYPILLAWSRGDIDDIPSTPITADQLRRHFKVLGRSP
jgi:integrase